MVQRTKDQTGPALSVNDPKWKCGDGGSPSGKLAWRSNHDGNVNDTWLVCR